MSNHSRTGSTAVGCALSFMLAGLLRPAAPTTIAMACVGVLRMLMRSTHLKQNYPQVHAVRQLAAPAKESAVSEGVHFSGRKRSQPSLNRRSVI